MSQTGDAQAASRTATELMATLMEASFEALGEGVILGTLPAYLERFGRGNARHLHQRFLDCVPDGAASALSAMNFVSDVTDTPYDMLDATKGHATKRLRSCEFLDAFQDRGDFPKAMICMLHRAAYQGSVNGLVKDPADGYDVQVQTRILFGDPHCDFEVLARGHQDATKDESHPAHTLPEGDDRDWLAYGFYTFILTSFVDYLTHQLPPERVEAILRDSARKVGAKVFRLMDRLGMLPADAEDAARAILTQGGRTFSQGLTVVGCPQAQHIQETTQGAAEAARDRVRENACRLCKHFVQGAVHQVDPNATVERDGALALGDDHCGYRIEGP